MMEPTAEYLLKLPSFVAAQWKAHKERMEQEARQLSTRLFQQKALNQKAVAAKLNEELSEEDFRAFKESVNAERNAIEQAQNRLNTEKELMQQLMEGAERSSVDVLGAWQNGDVNQRQSLAKAFFPEGRFIAPNQASLNRATSSLER